MLPAFRVFRLDSVQVFGFDANGPSNLLVSQTTGMAQVVDRIRRNAKGAGCLLNCQSDGIRLAVNNFSQCQNGRCYRVFC